MKYLLLLIGVFLVFFALCMHFCKGRIASTHVINLDSSQDRYAQFMKAAGDSGLQVERWRAINGKALTLADSSKYNLPRKLYERLKDRKRLGTVGCFLSHSTLLKHLEAQRCAPNDIHLVFEDDILLTPNFHTKVHAYVAQLPADWDYLQLNVIKPKTRPWKGAIHIPVCDVDGNYGTGAYAVRHGSLGKINAQIAKMRMPIDDQLFEKCGTWKWFSAVPDAVSIKDNGKTTLDD